MKTNKKPKKMSKWEKAKAHNDNVPQASLLGLPGELRNEIFRLALLESEEIVIKRRRRSIEPGLLRTCAAVRGEARPIFCGENKFRATLRNMRPDQGLAHWLWNNDTPGLVLHISNEGKPSWSALKRWVNAYWEGRAVDLGRDEPSLLKRIRICMQAFSLVDDMPDAKWQDVEAALETFRKAVEIANGKLIFLA